MEVVGVYQLEQTIDFHVLVKQLLTGLIQYPQLLGEDGIVSGDG